MFVLSWVVLLPVYAANSGGLKEGLDRFTFGNVGLNSTPRFAAPLIVAYIFTCTLSIEVLGCIISSLFHAFLPSLTPHLPPSLVYVLYLLRSEIAGFIEKRQDFLISKPHSQLAQSRTVLITGVPQDLLNEEALRKFTSYLPGGARHIWIVRELGKLPDVYDRRAAAYAKLESGETKLISLAQTGKAKPTQVELEKSGTEWSKYVDVNKRPQHKLGFLGLIGKKVDTINWATEEIQESNQELDQLRAKLDECPTHNSAFIEFNTQIAAHMFAQSLSHHMPLRMTGRWIEVAAPDVIWSTLNIDPLQQQLRGLISWAITIALIVFWAIPVAFVGLLSNVNSLCSRVSWMAWLCKLPAPIPGILQGAYCLSIPHSLHALTDLVCCP